MIEGFREKYLERLGLDPQAAWPLTAQTLATIQEAHAARVPFEIIDSMLGKTFDLSPEALFEKIVVNGRGGFCYENNHLLALTLEDMGFDVQLLAGWVPSCRNKFDHIFLRVTAQGQPWMVDVGFRNGPLAPLSFEPGTVQDGVKADYRIDPATAEEANTEGFGDDSYWLTYKKKGSDEWTRAFRFDLTPYPIEAFAQRCKEFTEDGWSPFQKRPSCSLETRAGRTYLNDEAFSTVIGGTLMQRPVRGGRDFAQTLLREFGVLPNSGDMLHAVTSADEPVSISQVVALEQQLAANGLPLRELMERAGMAGATAAAGLIDVQCIRPWATRDLNPRIVVLAGNGNNGGDGWVIADILRQNNYNVTLVTEHGADTIKAQPAAEVANEITMDLIIATSAAGIAAAQLDEDLPRPLDLRVNPSLGEIGHLLDGAGLIVDALLGTGFDADEVREPFATWIALANDAHDAGVPVLSIDVPSGLSAQTGKAANACINADATITMLRAKAGLTAPGAADYVGRLFVANLTD